MEDDLNLNLNFVDWLESFGEDIDKLDTSELVGTAPPEGAVRTSFFLDDDQKKILALLKQEVDVAKKKWNRYLSLRPGDQKVQPFYELSLQVARCRLIAETLRFFITSNLPAKFCQFVGMGFDDKMEVWVGPSMRRDIGDLPNPSTLYPPRF